MIRIFMLVISLVFAPVASLFSQNMIPDSSFEEYRRLPVKKNNSISCTKNWVSPSEGGAGDYYHDLSPWWTGAPGNIFGRQKPLTGDAYGGLCLRRKFCEYMSTKFSDTLKAGQEYRVEFYVCRAERSIGTVKELGMHFSRGILLGLPVSGVDFVPSIEFIENKGFRNKRKWVKYSAIYKANGFETSVMIGHFRNKNTKRFKGWSHYYFDDISVTPIYQDTLIDKVLNSNSEVTLENKINIKPTLNKAFSLNQINFEVNKSELLPSSFPEIEELVDLLRSDPSLQIQINGHTDGSGEEEFNVELSEARALSVASFLIDKGIDASRLQTKGYGSAHPLESNSSQEGRIKNRRVEFILSHAN
jgi:outer membrane protein OmpA-like peptidoglycan-associated protein